MKSNIFESKLQDKIDLFKQQLSSIRVGALSVETLGAIKVKVYGSEMSLREVSNLVSTGPVEVLVDPWDKSIAAELEENLRSLPSSGFSIVADGTRLRLKASELTLERREALSREIGRKKEESKIAIRLIRQDQMQSLDEMEKNGEISEDERFRRREEVEKLVKHFNEDVEALASAKQKQIGSL